MGDIQFNQIMQLCALVLILVGAYNTIMNAIKNRREEKKLRDSPVTQLTERVDRLDEMEGRITDMGRQSTIMLRGVRALLSHEVNGNSTDKLKSSMTEIDDYLINRQ